METKNRDPGALTLARRTDQNERLSDKTITDNRISALLEMKSC